MMLAGPNREKSGHTFLKMWELASNGAGNLGMQYSVSLVVVENISTDGIDFSTREIEHFICVHFLNELISQIISFF
jgi:hypothetical protein